ncbi:hypothetical protein [Helicobacter sp. 16-1353]|uniref:hypothetical protein n=1 Tax=Helicobacter sp. 16-1353 TaxID=2004996 RepID=UPI0015EE715C|nr:hypothetical protein [Helicobacter sp. 16-1353]
MALAIMFGISFISFGLSALSPFLSARMWLRCFLVKNTLDCGKAKASCKSLLISFRRTTLGADA